MAGEKKEMTAEEKEQALTEAALDASETLVVKVEPVDETDIDDFDFMENLEDITSELDIPPQLLTFDNPNNPEKPFRFVMRQLTTDEHGEIFQTLFDTDLMRKVLSETLDGNSQKDKDAAIDEMVEKVSDGDVAKRKKEREVASVYKCMLRPKKKSVKAVERLPAEMRKALFEACTKSINRVWLFR